MILIIRIFCKVYRQILEGSNGFLLYVDGADFTASMQTVTFIVDSGQRQCVEIDIMDDPVVEGDEPFSVGFELPPGVQLGLFSETTITILDDDGMCIIFW